MTVIWGTLLRYIETFLLIEIQQIFPFQTFYLELNHSMLSKKTLLMEILFMKPRVSFKNYHFDPPDENPPIAKC